MIPSQPPFPQKDNKQTKNKHYSKQLNNKIVKTNKNSEFFQNTVTREITVYEFLANLTRLLKNLPVHVTKCKRNVSQIYVRNDIKVKLVYVLNNTIPYNGNHEPLEWMVRSFQASAFTLCTFQTWFTFLIFVMHTLRMFYVTYMTLIHKILRPYFMIYRKKERTKKEQKGEQNGRSVCYNTRVSKEQNNTAS